MFAAIFSSRPHLRKGVCWCYDLAIGCEFFLPGGRGYGGSVLRPNFQVIWLVVKARLGGGMGER